MSELRLPYLNVVWLSGRFVAAPAELGAKADRKGAAFTIAVNRYRRGRPATTTFTDCVTWGQPAEFVLGFCSTGSAVLVSGSLSQYDRKDPAGQNRRVLQVSVATVQLLDKKSPEGIPPEESSAETEA